MNIKSFYAVLWNDTAYKKSDLTYFIARNALAYVRKGNATLLHFSCKSFVGTKLSKFEFVKPI